MIFTNPGLLAASRTSFVLLVVLAALGQVSAAPAYPLTKSINGRYLVDQNGTPFLLAGDAPQSLMVNISEADAAAYFANRRALGFNAVWIDLLCTTYTGGRADSSTLDGIRPFTGTVPATSSYDLTTPNEVYFAHADRVLALAGQYGLLVMLDPAETGGYLRDTPTLPDNGVARCRAYGQYLGNRYKGVPNLIWISGNDFDYPTYTAAGDAVVQAVALGIRDNDANHLQTVELGAPSGSLDDASWAPIIGLDAAYSWSPTYAQVLAEYNRPGFLPAFLVEAHYEYESIGWPPADHNSELGSPLVLRRQEYWTVLSGGAGQLYGNHYIWPFTSGWQGTLNSPGAIQIGYAQALFASRPWYALVPDQTHTVVTAGYGTYSATGLVSANNYVTAARTADGALVMAYLPTIQTVTLDLSRLSAAVTAQWFDPANGTYQAVPGSPFANSGSRDFTPPGNNGDGDGDWVLVLGTGGSPPLDTTAPSTPAGLTAAAAGSSQINLSWAASTDNVGVTQYLIERQDGGSAGFVSVGSAAGTTYGDTGLVANSTYSYRLRATDAAANVSGYSAVVSATTANSPTSGLVAGYSFNEGTGTTATDVSGNANTGVISGGAAWTTAGRFGNALIFDGSSALVTISDAPSLRLTTAMTLEAWVKPAVQVDVWRDVIYKGDDNYYIEGSSDRSSTPAAGGTFSGALSGPAALAVNVWSHLAVSYDGVTLRFFVNGVQVVSQAQTGAIATSANPLQIGGDSLWAQYFQGTIDEVRVYNRALGAPEIQVDMNTPIGTATTSSPTITTQPASQTATAGNPVTFTVAASGTPAPTYQWMKNGANLAGAIGGSYTIASVAPGDAGTYTVAVSNAAGSVTSTGAVLTVTVQQPPADTTAPSAPKNLTAATISKNQINLRWTASTDNVAVSGYRVEQKSGTGNFVQVGVASGASFSDTGLSSRTSYSFRVRASDAAGNLSGYSKTASARTQ